MFEAAGLNVLFLRGTWELDMPSSGWTIWLRLATVRIWQKCSAVVITWKFAVKCVAFPPVFQMLFIATVLLAIELPLWTIIIPAN